MLAVLEMFVCVGRLKRRIGKREEVFVPTMMVYVDSQSTLQSLSQDQHIDMDCSTFSYCGTLELGRFSTAFDRSAKPRKGVAVFSE